MSYYIAKDRFGQLDLCHYGVKDMKWGVRRFQNEDGSLTPAGILRYRKNGEEEKGLNRLAKDIAETKYHAALDRAMANKSIQRGDAASANVFQWQAERSEKSISKAEDLANSIIKDLEDKGFSVDSTSVRRYANAGHMILSSVLLGPVGTIIVGGIDLNRVIDYGPEAGGFINGKKFRVHS